MHWCVSQCEVTRYGLTHRQARENEWLPKNCDNSLVENDDSSVENVDSSIGNGGAPNFLCSCTSNGANGVFFPDLHLQSLAQVENIP